MLLFLFTITESISVSYITMNLPPTIVIESAILTICMAIGLTIYALKTKTDFTIMGGLLFIISCVGIGAMIL